MSGGWGRLTPTHLRLRQCTVVFQSAAAVKAAEREFASKGLRPRIVPSVAKVRIT